VCDFRHARACADFLSFVVLNFSIIFFLCVGDCDLARLCMDWWLRLCVWCHVFLSLLELFSLMYVVLCVVVFFVYGFCYVRFLFLLCVKLLDLFSGIFLRGCFVEYVVSVFS
jgi:hypothetical protein